MILLTLLAGVGVYHFSRSTGRFLSSLLARPVRYLITYSLPGIEAKNKLRIFARSRWDAWKMFRQFSWGDGSTIHAITITND